MVPLKKVGPGKNIFYFRLEKEKMDNYFYFEKGSYGIRKDQNLSDQYPVGLAAPGTKTQLGTDDEANRHRP